MSSACDQYEGDCRLSAPVSLSKQAGQGGGNRLSAYRQIDQKAAVSVCFIVSELNKSR